MSGKAPGSLRDAIEQFFRGKGREDLLSVGSVLDTWGEAAGERAAAHSRAAALVDGVLEVEVDSPLWGSYVLVRRAQILRHFGEKHPDARVRDLRVKTGTRGQGTAGG